MKTREQAADQLHKQVNHKIYSAFIDRMCEGARVSEIAKRAGMSKANFMRLIRQGADNIRQVGAMSYAVETEIEFEAKPL
jgi:hypothetical protein